MSFVGDAKPVLGILGARRYQTNIPKDTNRRLPLSREDGGCPRQANAKRPNAAKFLTVRSLDRKTP